MKDTEIAIVVGIRKKELNMSFHYYMTSRLQNLEDIPKDKEMLEGLPMWEVHVFNDRDKANKFIDEQRKKWNIKE